MEQESRNSKESPAALRRARMLRELNAYGIRTELVVEAMKLAGALVISALAALWLVSHTDTVAKQAGAGSEVGVEFVTVPDTASSGGTAAPGAIAQPALRTPLTQPDTPQRDVHSDGGQFFLAP